MKDKDKVVTMPGVIIPTDEPSKYVVEVLKEVSADAESGLLRAVFLIGFTKDGDTKLAICNDSPEDIYKVIGSIEMLKQECLEIYSRHRKDKK